MNLRGNACFHNNSIPTWRLRDNLAASGCFTATSLSLTGGIKLCRLHILCSIPALSICTELHAYSRLEDFKEVQAKSWANGYGQYSIRLIKPSCGA